MGKFTHYLVTRFNVPVDIWVKDKHGQPLLNELWMTHRLQLFSAYCVPSVVHQKEQNFQWLIYCDELTSITDRLKIAEAVKSASNSSLRFVKNMSELKEDLISSLRLAKTPYVLTTRLDNDDVITTNFIKTIQRNFVTAGKSIINLEGGYFYDPRNQVLTYMHIPDCNNFISLIESSEAFELQTVFGFPHTQIPETIKIIGVNDGMYWLRLVHDRNIRSTLKGKPVWVASGDLLQTFGFPISISFVNTIRYMFTRMSTRL